MKISFRPILLFIALASSLIACGDTTPKPSITAVTLVPTSTTMTSGSSQNVSATITGTGAFDNTINWTASEGTFLNPTGANNSYTAPAVTVSKTVTITATSKADATKLATTTVTVNPPAPSSSITLVTASAVKTALAASEVTTLSAVVTGTGAFSNGVTWSKTSGNGTLSATTGSSIDFTAPSATTANTTVVRATSLQDTSKFAEVTLTTAAAAVNAPTVSISSPSVDVFTKGTVSIQLVVTGAPDTVELLRDGVVLVALTTPYTYVWDTTTEPEKTYSITAKAKKAGTADVTSAAKQITVDRTAPTVVSKVPASGAVNVFLADEISTTFSEPILASSVSTSSAQLKVGSNVLTTIPTLDTAGTKLVLKPSFLPALTATITVALNGLTDRAGNALVVANTSFNAPDWQAPGGAQALSSVTSSNPTIAIASGGNPVVAWAEAGNINVKKWNGTTWDLLPTTLGGVNSMALDSAGNPIISWNQFLCCSQENKIDTFVKKWDGAAWVQLGTTLDVNANVAFANGNPTNSSIAIDSSDNPTVVWSEYNGVDNYNIYAKKWNGTAWVSLGITLDNTASNNAFTPSITTDSNGNPIVTWQEPDGTSYNIYVKKWNGSSWTSLGTTLNNTASNNAFTPSIATDSSGNSIVTWREFDGTSESIYVKKWNGSSWTSLGTTLDNDPSKNAFTPSIATDSSGNPIVTWREFDGTSDNIYVKKWNGTAWISLGTTLDNTASNNVESPSIATDSSGNPIVTWQEFGGASDNTYVKRFNRIP